MKKKVFIWGLSVILCFSAAVPAMAQTAAPVYLVQDTTDDITYLKKNANLMSIYYESSILTDYYLQFIKDFLSNNNDDLDTCKNISDTYYNKIAGIINTAKNTSGVYTVDEIKALNTMFNNLTTCKNVVDNVIAKAKLSDDNTAAINYLDSVIDNFLTAVDLTTTDPAWDCYGKIMER